MTHEYFTVEDVVSDAVFRVAPLNIAGYKFKFYKLSPSLLDFGVRRKEGGEEGGLSTATIRYSDTEKTLLDFIYVWRYNGIPEDKIVADISEWTKKASKERLSRYAKKYPKSVARIAERVMTERDLIL